MVIILTLPIFYMPGSGWFLYLLCESSICQAVVDFYTYFANLLYPGSGWFLYLLRESSICRQWLISILTLRIFYMQAVGDFYTYFANLRYARQWLTSILTLRIFYMQAVVDFYTYFANLLYAGSGWFLYLLCESSICRQCSGWFLYLLCESSICQAVVDFYNYSIVLLKRHLNIWLFLSLIIQTYFYMENLFVYLHTYVYTVCFVIFILATLPYCLFSLH